MLLCGQSLYCKYERQGQGALLEFAAKPAKFYDVSLDYLVGLTNKKHFR